MHYTVHYLYTNFHLDYVNVCPENAISHHSLPTSLWHLHCWTRLDKNWEQKIKFSVPISDAPVTLILGRSRSLKVYKLNEGYHYAELRRFCLLQSPRKNLETACIKVNTTVGLIHHYSDSHQFSWVKNKIFPTCYQRVIFWHTHTHKKHKKTHTQLVNTSNTFAPTMNWVYHLIYSSARENTWHIQWIHKFMSHFWRQVSIYIMALDTDVSWWIDCKALCMDNHGLPVSI